MTAPRRPLAPRPPLFDDADEPWRDRSLADADLANAVLHGGEIARCRLSRCRLTGLQVPEGRVADVLFEDCRIDLSAFRWATLERVRFERCAMRECDLTGARLQDVLFDGCDLRLATFDGARSSRLELRGCDTEGLGGVDGLRGALVAWPDALGLLGSLVAGAGLVVLPEEG